MAGDNLPSTSRGIGETSGKRELVLSSTAKAYHSAVTPKRLKVQNPNDALDIDSDDIPDNFKCPICFEVFLDKIYGCSSGHLICGPCQRNMPGSECPQCRAPMKDAKRNLIRVLCWEQHMDSFLYKCRFHNNGCQETHSRTGIQKHIENCKHEGNRVQICQFFQNGENCQFWSCINKPAEIMQHFKLYHSAITTRPQKPSGRIRKYASALKAYDDYVDSSACTIIRDGINRYLIARRLLGNGYLSCACFHINPTTDGQKTGFEMRIKSQTNRATDITWNVPIISLLDSEQILRDPPIGVSKSTLKNDFVDKNGRLHFTLHMI